MRLHNDANFKSHAKAVLPPVELSQRFGRLPTGSNRVDGEKVAVRIGEPCDPGPADRGDSVLGFQVRQVIIDRRDATGSQLRHDGIQVVHQECRERRVAHAGGFALIERQGTLSGAETGFSLGVRSPTNSTSLKPRISP